MTDRSGDHRPADDNSPEAFQEALMVSLAEGPDGNIVVMIGRLSVPKHQWIMFGFGNLPTSHHDALSFMARLAAAQMP